MDCCGSDRSWPAMAASENVAAGGDRLAVVEERAREKGDKLAAASASCMKGEKGDTDSATESAEVVAGDRRAVAAEAASPSSLLTEPRGSVVGGGCSSMGLGARDGSTAAGLGATTRGGTTMRS